MSPETERMQEELKLELAAKQDQICRQENSDFADERVVKRGLPHSDAASG
jgi:hypothetical protein